MKKIREDSPGHDAILALKRAVLSLKIFHRLADEWNLDAAERHCLLGFEAAEAEVGLSEDGQLRLSHLLNCYACLHTILAVPLSANREV